MTRNGAGSNLIIQNTRREEGAPIDLTEGGQGARGGVAEEGPKGDQSKTSRTERSRDRNRITRS